MNRRNFGNNTTSAAEKGKSVSKRNLGEKVLSVISLGYYDIRRQDRIAEMVIMDVMRQKADEVDDDLK